MADALATITCTGTFSEYTTSLDQLKGHCWRCGVDLPPRRRHWCSDDCGQWWRRNHDWNSAREAALKRDNQYCVKCGADGKPTGYFYRYTPGADSQYKVITGRTMFPVKLEVNHIVPREGRGYGQGCHNHQENLETLCHTCHLAVTAQQRADRQQQQTK